MKEKTSGAHPVDLDTVKITGGFWSRFQDLVRTQVIPYQWEALNDRIEGAAPSHCMENFKVAAGQREGSFGGCVFQDSDFAKWIEAVGYSLTIHPDPELEKTADEAIDLVCSAQQPDGYLNTYYIINGLEDRFTNLAHNHELYCLGHLMEGAIAYYQATGKDKLLNAVRRYADLVDSLFGAEEGKLQGYPGHEIIEMALVKLADVTGEERYLRLAKYFIDQRGQEPNYFREEIEKSGKPWGWAKSPFGLQYYQAGKPVREQTAAEGHAVRAVYLYSGMADVARKTGDESLWNACRTLWDSIVRRRMYVTGSIGSAHYGESFTFDYDLPNDSVYGETCAAIGLVFFARRMLETEAKGEYADVMEQALYNGVISGMSLDGRSFFYVNPLEVIPEASEKDHDRSHVKVQRQKWFGCACCPPNLARLVSSLGMYMYGTGTLDGGEVLYHHLYADGRASFTLGSKRAEIRTETRYPWDGTIKTLFSLPEGSASFTYALRIPGWCDRYTLTVNGQPLEYRFSDGYAYISRTFQDGDAVTLELEMSPRLISASPEVRDDIGKVCVCRGPVVYCLEQEDNGAKLHKVRISGNTSFREAWEPETLGGIVSLECTGTSLDKPSQFAGALYQRYTPPVYKPQVLRWIPYYAWANRSAGEMTVWVRVQD